MMSSVLYITYDGLLEPLGRSQVLAYLEGLSKEHDIYVISFEKPGDWKDLGARYAVESRVSAANIMWFPRRYHKRPSGPATAWDIFAGILRGLWLIPRHGIGILHARSYVPAVVALVLKRVTGAKFIFDMRGFWADERLDGEIWSRQSRIYKVAKWFERKFLLNADHVVSLTNAGAKELNKFDYLHDRIPPITVIPTCADLSKFRPIRYRPERFVIGYIGSVGTWYMFNEVVRCFDSLLAIKPDACLLVINRGEHDYVRRCIGEEGVSLENVEIRSATYDEMPDQIARMHAGIFFIKPVYSKRASAPTKLAEFLGCGIPCIANRGVGDVSEILEGGDVGVVLDNFEVDHMRAGLRRLIELANSPDITRRCTDTAYKYFSLEEGVKRYRKIYESLGAG